MSTPSLNEYQASIAAALEADAFFAGLDVLIDDGKKLKGQEAALSTKGLVLVVSPVLTLRRTDDARKEINTAAVFAVHLRSNPEINLNGTTGAGIDLHEAIFQCIRAVITAHRDPSGTREYVRAAGNLAEMTPEDSGLLTYSVLFEASVQMAV